MWKYIAIAALVLFAAASFVFHKTHSALSSPGGEVSALQAQYETAIAKNKEVFVDECIAAYAKMRNEWLTQRKSELEAEKDKVELEDSRIKGEIERLTAEWKSRGGDIEEERDKLKAAVTKIAEQEGLRSLGEKTETDMEEMDASDPELFQKIAANIAALDAKKDAMNAKLQAETASVEQRTAERDRLAEAIVAEDDIAKDRRARLSPADLNCRISRAETGLAYVVIDKGIDGGVVIGSRLAVMRGDKKICELNVTNVEANRSSCDLVYNTLITGEMVQTGDRVVAVRASVAPKE